MSGVALRKGYLDLKLEAQQPFVPEWTVAIFSLRESARTLAESVRAVLTAIESDAIVDVIVNGNEPLAREVAGFVDGLKLNLARRLLVRLWYVAEGDKAHAWNQYLYGIWPGAGLTYFVDGYVRVHRHAFTRIATAMAEDNHAQAATGVPSQGRSSARLRAEMQRSNGIHGNLYAIRAPILKPCASGNLSCRWVSIARIPCWEQQLNSISIPPDIGGTCTGSGSYRRVVRTYTSFHAKTRRLEYPTAAHASTRTWHVRTSRNPAAS